MPIVIICGQPCSGKSTVAAQLEASFIQRGLEVQIISEPSLHLIRNDAYQDVVSEKNTRGLMRSAVERALSNKKAVTILDSLNNIKGYRYELWCIARAAGTRYCMVHVDTPTDVCAAWNTAREGDTYSDAIFKDLAGRFERPDTRNRWDAPLFTIRPVGGSEEERAEEVLPSLVSAMCDEGGSEVQASGAAGGPVRALQPTSATTNAPLAATNALHDIDAAAQEVVDAIVEAQAAAAGGPAGLVRLGSGDNSQAGGARSSGSQGGGEGLAIRLTQNVSLAELRRHKRAFLKLATKLTFARLTDTGAARRLFIDYLVEHAGGALPGRSMG